MTGPATAARRPAAEVRDLVEAVPDPELPMITLGDLGVIRSVAPDAAGRLVVEFTPTFLGCPAQPEIIAALAGVLASSGHADGHVRAVLTPSWTPQRITAEGRRKLAEHGIAPPAPAGGPVPVRLGTGVPCPHCGSPATRPYSDFGPTRCQSMLRCTACRETFPYVGAR